VGGVIIFLHNFLKKTSIATVTPSWSNPDMTRASGAFNPGSNQPFLRKALAENQQAVKLPTGALFY